MSDSGINHLDWGTLPLLRKVVETEEFQAQRDELIEDVHRYDEVRAGVDWALSREPEIFPFGYEPWGIRVLKTVRHGNLPRLRLFFTSTDDTVVLRWIEILADEEETA